MDNLGNLKSLLSLIRSTSMPIAEGASAKTVKNDQWDEVDSIISQMEASENEVPDSGSRKIADKVKEALDKEFPGAVLNTEPVNNNPRIVMFHQGEQHFRIISIDA